jgi:hypothetical protein
MTVPLVATVLLCALMTAVRLRQPGPVGFGFILTIFALGALSGALAVLN